MGMVEQVRHRWCRWKCGVDQNMKIDAFLAEVIEVSKKHGLSISHQDGGGAFEVVEFNERDVNWLMDAEDATGGAG